MKILNICALTFGSALITTTHVSFAQHGHDHIEEVIIISDPLRRSVTESALRATILEGEALQKAASSTLGDTLSGQLSVNGTSFSSNASSPIIRGQSGSRVSVLQDGLSSGDVASLSPDHKDAIEPLLANRIEVLRGPATLLYGSGAIGGVVNVIDKRIPTELDQEFVFEQRHDTNNNGNTSIFGGTASTGSLAFHLEGSFDSTDNISIPGYAINEDEHDKEEDEHEEEEGNSFGEVENSDYENSQLSLGLSHITSKGYVGASFSSQESDYGLPPGSHAHEEDGDQNDVEEEEEEVVRIDLKSERFNLKANYEVSGFFNALEGSFAATDYQHVEVENGADGILFENDSVEFRGLAHFESNDTFKGTFGTQISTSTFSAEGGHGHEDEDEDQHEDGEEEGGEEAFIPETDNQNNAIFFVSSYDQGSVVYDFGLRAEQQNYESGDCDLDFTSTSANVSLLWRANKNENLIFGLAHSERAPSTEELFSNLSETGCASETDETLLIEHIPTQRIEIGNPNLDTETSQNLELTWLKHSGGFTFEVSSYINLIQNYTYLRDRPIIAGEDIVADYIQEDARFIGLEAKIAQGFDTKNGSHFDFEVLADTVSASILDGTNLPRIPASRFGAGISYSFQDFSTKLSATHSFDQNSVAPNEEESEEYTRVNLNMDYHFNLKNSEFILFARADNLLDEEIRNHTSFTREFAPEKGRGVTLGLRFNL